MSQTYAVEKLISSSAAEVLENMPKNPEYARQVVFQVAKSLGIPTAETSHWQRRLCIGVLVAAIALGGGIEIERVSGSRAWGATLARLASCRVVASEGDASASGASLQMPANYTA